MLNSFVVMGLVILHLH